MQNVEFPSSDIEDPVQRLKDAIRDFDGDAFYEIVNEYRQRFCEAEEQCILPENPDMEAVEAFVEDVNRRVVYGEI